MFRTISVEPEYTKGKFSGGASFHGKGTHFQFGDFNDWSQIKSTTNKHFVNHGERQREKIIWPKPVEVTMGPGPSIF